MRLGLFFWMTLLTWSYCSGQEKFLAVDTSAIRWCETRKLAWSDFKHVPDTSVDFKARSHLGIPIEITMSSTKGLSYEVVAVFDRSSWSSTDDYYCLKHEQLHFDITELYARKIRKLIVINRKSTRQQILDGINKMIDEYRKTQSQYDFDTSHGTSVDSQEKWRDSINLELKKFNYYPGKYNCQ